VGPALEPSPNESGGGRQCSQTRRDRPGGPPREPEKPAIRAARRSEIAGIRKGLEAAIRHPEELEYVRNDGFCMICELLATRFLQPAVEAFLGEPVAGDEVPEKLMEAVRDIVRASEDDPSISRLEMWDDWIKIAESPGVADISQEPVELVPVGSDDACGLVGSNSERLTASASAMPDVSASSAPSQQGASTSRSSGQPPAPAASATAARAGAWWAGADEEDGPPPSKQLPTAPDPWAGGADPWSQKPAAGGDIASETAGEAEEEAKPPAPTAKMILAIWKHLPEDAPQGVREYLAAWARGEQARMQKENGLPEWA